MENLQPSSSHTIMAASTLYFLSLVFVQFVNIKTQFCSSNLFSKIQNFSMHKLVWNRTEFFSIQQKREECFRTQNSLLPVFLLHHRPTCTRVCPLPEESGETLRSVCPGMMARTCCCAGRLALESAGRLCPADTDQRVLITFSEGQMRSPSLVLFPVLGSRCGAFPPGHRRFVSEGWDKNAACPCGVAPARALAVLSKWSCLVSVADER